MSEIMTHTRIMFDPVHPDPELIGIVDIAHALSMLCRANGHFPTFYSVGQHCVNCMQEAAARGYSRHVQLACLLHDASEAYLSDVTRPVKKELPRYLEIEKPLQDVIWNKYLGEPLTQEEYDQVFEIDDAILYHEFLSLMDIRLTAEEPMLHTKPVFEFIGFRQCEELYLRHFQSLTREKREKITGKQARYQELIDRARLSYAAYDGPPDRKDPRLSWCDDCREINLWTYWQGRGHLDARIMLVGQDWGCARGVESEALLQRVRRANQGFDCNYMEGNDSVTDLNLVTLFREALDLDVLQDCPEVFFTNFVLGYRNKGTSGNFKKDWVDHDKRFFRELAEIITPKAILCLGRSTFEGFSQLSEKRIRCGSDSTTVLLKVSRTRFLWIWEMEKRHMYLPWRTAALWVR